MVDNTSKYCYNQNIYLGSCEKSLRENLSIGEYVVKKLSESILRKGQNIKTDNFFTTLNLSKFLLKNNTTLVGTVKKNAKFLTAEHMEKKDLHESAFF